MSNNLICSVFKSNRNGTKVYIDGYSYNKATSKEKCYYWVCEMRNDEIYKCKSTLKTILNDQDEHIASKPPQNHNHEPNVLRKNIADFRKQLKNDVAGGAKFCKILNDNKSKSTSDVLQNLPSTSALKQCMYRQKRKLQDNIVEPDSIEFDINESQTQINGKNFIIKDRKYDKKRIIMMSTLYLVTVLSKSFYWILDGTFKIVPTIFSQLYTIHGNIFINDQKTFPLVFCLCTHKDKRTYDTIFEMLIEYGTENNIDFKPKVCILDFEKAAILSLRSSFENTVLHGCNFHLGQIIYRKVQSTGMSQKYSKNVRFNKDIKCLLALSYLKATDIPLYFNKYIESLTDEDSKTIAYWFEENYVSGTSNTQPKYLPEYWSCHEMNNMKIPRTSNSAEAWHHKINQIIDKNHPGVYFLLKELIKETISNSSEIEQKMNGAPPEKKRKKYICKDEHITRILTQKEDYSELKLLRSLAIHLKLK